MADGTTEGSREGTRLGAKEGKELGITLGIEVGEGVAFELLGRDEVLGKELGDAVSNINGFEHARAAFAST